MTWYRFKCLVEELNSLQIVNLNAVGEDLPAESLTELDYDVVTPGSDISDANFIFYISNDVDSNVDDKGNNTLDDIDETLPLLLANIEVEEVLKLLSQSFPF